MLNSHSKYLFSSAYLPPISYFSTLIKAENAVFEVCEFYSKQTYRNRCKILTANGIMDLSIPVEHANKVLIKDVRISYFANWQTLHWRAIESAYNNSPFFEYYKDDFLPFYQKKYDFLFDFNLNLIHKIFDLLEIRFPKIEYTEKFQTDYNLSINDLRNNFNPKKTNDIPLKPYYQVFNEKFGFTPDLSIVDMLFNCGNETILLLN